jgi:cell division protease FtsH
MTSGREYSDSTAQLLDEEISRILLEQEQRAHALLTQHRRGLELVAEKLIEDETIDGATVGRLVQEALQSPSSEAHLNN